MVSSFRRWESHPFPTPWRERERKKDRAGSFHFPLALSYFNVEAGTYLELHVRLSCMYAYPKQEMLALDSVDSNTHRCKIESEISFRELLPASEALSATMSLAYPCLFRTNCLAVVRGSAPPLHHFLGFELRNKTEPEAIHNPGSCLVVQVSYPIANLFERSEQSSSQMTKPSP